MPIDWAKELQAPRFGALGAAVLCGTLGVLAGEKMEAADYFHEDFFEWSTSYGYTKLQWVCLLAQTVLCPAAGLALVGYFYMANASPGAGGGASGDSVVTPESFKMVEYLIVLGVLLSCAGVVGATHCGDVLACGIFCVGSSSDDDTNGMKVTTGLLYFFSLLVLSCFALLLVYKSALRLVKHGDAITAEERTRLLAPGGSDAAGPAGGASSGATRAEGARPASVDKAGRMLGDNPHATAAAAAADRGLTRSSVVAHPRPGYSYGELRASLARRRWAGILTCLLVFYPFMLFAITALPSWWNSWNVSDITEYQQEHITNKAEYTGAVWNIRLSSNLILKLYGDVLIYYLFIYAVALTGIASLLWPPLQRVLCQRHGVILHFAWGELILMLGFAMLLAGEFLYWYLSHGWEETEVESRTKAERFARSMGQIANTILGLLVLPCARNSMWTAVFGVSWEYSIKFHRWLGYSFLAAVFVHMCAWWKVFNQQNTFPHDILNVPLKYHADNFTAPLGMILGLLVWVCMGVFAYETVRRKAFELFYFLHMVYAVLFLGTLWHAPSSWYYIVAGIVLWVVDHGIRFCASCSDVHVVAIEALSGDVTRLSYLVENGGRGPFGGEARPMEHDMAQFAFVCVPDVSQVQWHPFTISSSPQDNMTTHMIKSMGPGTWTEDLYELAKQRAHDVVGLHAPLAVCVDGPYGAAFDPQEYQHVLLVAGGVGVTPMISCLRCMHAIAVHAREDEKSFLPSGGFQLPQRIRLVWAARDARIFDAFTDTLQLLHDNSDVGRFSISLYCSQGKGKTEQQNGRGSDGTTGVELKSGESDVGRNDEEHDGNDGNGDERVFDGDEPSSGRGGVTRSGFVYHSGRPSLESEVQLASGFGANALVYVCGPDTMRDEIMRLACQYRVNVKVETFEL